MSLDTVRVFAIAKLPWIKKQQRKLREQERETAVGKRPGLMSALGRESARPIRGGQGLRNQVRRSRLVP
jgi:predicted metal-dependent hydrolase